MRIKLLLFLLFISNMHSQSYLFDQELTYRFSYDSSYYDSVIYFNSDDPNYSLSLTFGQNSSGNKAFISDLKNKITHEYSFSKKMVGDDFEYSFVYLKSRVHQENPKLLNLSYKINNFSSDSLEADFTLYNNKKSTSVQTKARLKFSETKKNLFPLSRFYIMDHSLENLDLKYPKNVVLDYVEHTVKGKKKTYKKLSINSINFEIKAPKVIKY